MENEITQHNGMSKCEGLYIKSSVVPNKTNCKVKFFNILYTINKEFYTDLPTKQDDTHEAHWNPPFALLSESSTHGRIPQLTEVQFQVQARQ